MNLKNKIALVTGANRGIGYEIAKTLAKYGAKIAGTSSSEKGSSEINTHFTNMGKGFFLDLMNLELIEKVIKKIQNEFGEIDILINNAGIIRDNLLIRMKNNEWKDIINVNLTSIFYLTKSVIGSMLKKRFGRIISIGSVIGNIGNIGQTNYSTSKAGLIGFSKSLALEVASRGITVNIIAPGFIETDMTKKLNENQRANILSKIPIGRLGNAKEIADAVAFLSSEKASYITGETLHINGGIYMA